MEKYYYIEVSILVKINEQIAISVQISKVSTTSDEHLVRVMEFSEGPQTLTCRCSLMVE